MIKVFSSLNNSSLYYFFIRTLLSIHNFPNPNIIRSTKLKSNILQRLTYSRCTASVYIPRAYIRHFGIYSYINYKRFFQKNQCKTLIKIRLLLCFIISFEPFFWNPNAQFAQKPIFSSFKANKALNIIVLLQIYGNKNTKKHPLLGAWLVIITKSNFCENFLN